MVAVFAAPLPASIHRVDETRRPTSGTDQWDLHHQSPAEVLGSRTHTIERQIQVVRTGRDVLSDVLGEPLAFPGEWVFPSRRFVKQKRRDFSPISNEYLSSPPSAPRLRVSHPSKRQPGSLIPASEHAELRSTPRKFGESSRKKIRTCDNPGWLPRTTRPPHHSDEIPDPSQGTNSDPGRERTSKSKNPAPARAK